MELEFHQLDLRYEHLRRRAPEREKRLLASLAHAGQLVPIVVVGGQQGGQAAVVVDGYKRIRALKRLKADTIIATVWELAEIEALVLERLMRSTGADDAFEQGWLLLELQDRFDLSQEELARRFDKSVSWVSRRLSLVMQLPEEIQEGVRRGELVPHAAMKYLVPLARANREACLQLVASLGKKKPSSRQMGALYGAWLSGDAQVRERILSDPWLFLRAEEESRRAQGSKRPSAEKLIADLDTLGRLCRRNSTYLQTGFAKDFSADQCEEVRRCLAQAKVDSRTFFQHLDQEIAHARPEPTHEHS